MLGVPVYNNLKVNIIHLFCCLFALTSDSLFFFQLLSFHLHFSKHFYGTLMYWELSFWGKIWGWFRNYYFLCLPLCIFLNKVSTFSCFLFFLLLRYKKIISVHSDIDTPLFLADACLSFSSVKSIIYRLLSKDPILYTIFVSITCEYISDREYISRVRY